MTRLLSLFDPAEHPSDWSFGYLPTGDLARDAVGRLLGHRNFLKRLQAPAILAALDTKPSHRVLDFGCGSGYFTVEMAKLAAEAVGLDVTPHLRTLRIPLPLIDRLRYVLASGTEAPFPDHHFDRILASEVLPMVGDPSIFLQEMRRLLKPGGRLVVVNGSGPIPIREAYRSGSPRLERLRRRYPDRFPESYDAYCARLQAMFGTTMDRFMSDAEVVALMTEAGFSVLRVAHAPDARAGAWFAWRQFEALLRDGAPTPIGQSHFWTALWRLRSRRNGPGYEGGGIFVADAAHG